MGKTSLMRRYADGLFPPPQNTIVCDWKHLNLKFDEGLTHIKVNCFFCLFVILCFCFVIIVFGVPSLH